MSHYYLTNCQLVLPIKSFYIFFTIYCLLLVFGWILTVWHYYPEESSSLQRGLLILPVMKLIQVFIYGIYVGECPWEN